MTAMTVAELIRKLGNVPRDAQVYVEPRHGLLQEQAHGVMYTSDEGLAFCRGGHMEWTDHVGDRVTAILIY